MELNTILNGDSLEMLRTLPEQSVNMCVTSPPYYGLRDYGEDGQIGLEETPEKYVERLVDVFREVRRVLKNDGTLWLNLGDSYCSTAPGTMSDPLRQEGILNGVTNKAAESRRQFRPYTPQGMKPKDLMGIPWMIAFALRSDGWYLRQDIIWHKPNPMPESVKDRCTKAHEYVFLLSKSAKYYYNHEAIKEDATTNENRPDGVVRNRIYEYDSKRNNNPEAYLGNPDQSFRGQKTKGKVPINGMPQRHGEDIPTSRKRNKRSIWTVNTKPYSEAHFAVFPDDLIKPCVLAGSKKGGVVLDPFFGSGTTGEVAIRAGRKFIGVELNPEYVEMATKRLSPFLTQHNLFEQELSN